MEAEGGQQVHHDIVVVAGVKRDVVTTGLGDGTDHVAGLVAVEGSDFDGDNILNLRKPAPERVRQHSPAGGGLKVKPNQRNDLSHGAAVSDQVVFVGRPERGEAEESGVITPIANQGRLGDGLFCHAADTGNSGERGAVRVSACQLRCRQFEHGPEQSNLRLADGELSRMHPDGQSAGACRKIVSEESPLPAFIELAPRIQRQRAGRHDQPAV